MSKKINIDIWRFIVSFLIVAIHISPFDKISPEFDFFFTRILGRIAVPLFLMITGYYILDRALKDKQVLVDITILKDVFINGTLYHLWYFPALIVGVWITYYLVKKLGRKKALIATILLYIIGVFGDSYYGITIMNQITKNIYEFIFNIFDYTRNGLFYVPIFICLGHIVKTDTRKNTKLNLLYALLFFILISAEGSILHYYNLQRHDSMYLFLLPLMYFLFCYLMDHSKTSNKKIRNIATYIYIFHPLFIVGIRFVSGIIGMDKIFVENNLILYLLVCITTTIFAFLIEKIKEVVKNERK